MECEMENCHHKATILFSSEPIFALTHGGGTDICQCCYIVKIEDELKNIQNNLKKQKAILKGKGCE